MKRITAVLAGVAALALLSACGGGGGSPLSSDPAPSGSAAAGAPITIGSADFTENKLLAEIYAQALESKGVTVTRKFGVGAREIYYKGLTDGSIDLVPDYTGVLLQFIDKAAPETESEAVYTALKGKVPAALTVLDKSAAEDKDAIVVTPATAAKYGNSLDAFAKSCGELVFGGPPEFQTRPDGIPGLVKNYSCTFKEFRALDTGGPLTVKALEDGTVQAADLFTTDPTIKDKGFVELADPKNNFAAQNVVPLINKAKATPEVTAALNAVSGKLTTDGLTDLLRQLSAPDKPNVDVVAKDWLTKNGLL
jgi:osmoprotectant transport system substrate-binding protein